MNLLTSYDIDSIETIHLRGNNELVVEFLSRKGEVRARFSNLVFLNLSNDLVDRDKDLVVIEVSHENRQLEEVDLQNYSFEKNQLDIDSTKYHLIRIHGSTVVEIICEDFDALIVTPAIV